MKKDKRKPNKLEIEVDLKKNKNYHFVNSLPNTFFPYEPYPEQLEIIKTIQEAVKNKENSLI
jgi:Rad3-related DNA helicase